MEDRKELNLDNICMWWNVARNDLKKAANSNPYITLSEDKPCYICSGYDFECKEYKKTTVDYNGQRMDIRPSAKGACSTKNKTIS